MKKISIYFLLLTTGFASAQDFDAPTFSSVTLSPTTVDISSGAVTVTASIRVQDVTGVDLTSLNQPYFSSGNPGIVSGYNRFSRWILVSGDSSDGIYSAAISLSPQHVPGDTYNYNASYFYDTTGYYDEPSQISFTVENNPNLISISRTSQCSGTLPSLSGNDYADNATYQWQQSENGNTFIDISGAVSPSYRPTGTISTTLYFRRAQYSNGNLNSNSNVVSVTFCLDDTAPTVTLTSNPLSLTISNSSVVTITATFSEAMAATPTLSLSGIISNAVMSATSSSSVWEYTWTVSTSLTSTTATVSATDLAGNAYSGSDSLTFTISSTASCSINGPPEPIHAIMMGAKNIDNLVAENTGLYYNNTICQGTTSTTFFVQRATNPNWDLEWEVSFGTSTISYDQLGNATVTWDTSLFSTPSDEAKVRVRNVACNATEVSAWHEIELWVVQDNGVNPEPTMPILETPIALNEQVSGETTGERPSCEILSTTSDTQFFTRAVAGSNNDYQSLEWELTSTPDISSTVLSAGTINSLGIVAWNPGFFGYYTIGVRPINCDGNPGNWTRETFSITQNQENAPDFLVYDLPNSPIQEGGVVSTTVTSNQNVFFYIRQSDLNLLNWTYGTPGPNQTGVVTSSTNPDRFYRILDPSNEAKLFWNTSSGTLSNRTLQLTLINEDCPGDLQTICSIHIPKNPPVVNLSSTPSSLIVSNSSIVTITAAFSEAMAATPTLSLSGIVSDALMSKTSSSSVWQYSWTVSTSLTSTTATVSGTDLTGIAYSGSDSLTFTIPPPPCDITWQSGPLKFSDSQSVNNLESIAGIVYQFNTNCDDNINASISWSPSEPSGITMSFSEDNNNYRASITGTPSAEVASGTYHYSITLRNVNQTALQTVSGSLTINGTKPEVAITVSDNLLNASEQATITFSLTESSTSFTQSDVTIIGGGSLSNFTSISSSVYKVTYAPPSNSAGTVSIVIEAGSFSDMAGNTNVASSSVFEVDTVPPNIDDIGYFETSDLFTYTINDSEPITFTVVYSEPMLNSFIEIEQLIPTVSSIVSKTPMIHLTSTDSKTWTYGWDVPSGDNESVSVRVYGIDLAGNLSNQKLIAFNIDNTSPQMTISKQSGGDTISGLSTVTIIFTPSEIISDTTFTLADINVSQGSLFDFPGSPGIDYMPGEYFSARYNVPENYSGNITISIDSASFTDYAGNPNTASSTTFSIDSARPEAAISISDDLLNSSEQATITFNLTESSSDFTQSDITITGGGSLSSFSSVSSLSYTVQYIPPSSTTGTVTISLDNGVFADLAGNGNVSSSISIIVDTEVPSIITYTSNDTDNILYNEQDLIFTVTFSEPMQSVTGSITTPSAIIETDETSEWYNSVIGTSSTSSDLYMETTYTVSSSTDSRTWSFIFESEYGLNGEFNSFVSGFDLAGNNSSPLEPIEFSVDSEPASIISSTLNEEGNQIRVVFNEPVVFGSLVSDTSQYLNNGVYGVYGGNPVTLNVLSISVDPSSSDTFILDISIDGITNGDEILELVPSWNPPILIDIAGNIPQPPFQASRVKLNNTPPQITETSISPDNSSIVITFSEPVYGTVSASAPISLDDIQLSISGGTATLSSTIPTSLDVVGQSSYELSIALSGPISGQEVITVLPAPDSVFDDKGAQLDQSVAQSNTVTLYDKTGPLIRETSVEDKNAYVDVLFNEGVYGQDTNMLSFAKSSLPPSRFSGTGVTSMSFELIQVAGASYGLTIDKVVNDSGLPPVGGE
ncbi:MAG: Ig-like domain-containing protein, partial [Flavobacteriaceae bacterium]|nr:Ig-like domain-containing protein [Flavobacteriaceae bacterium]